MNPCTGAPTTIAVHDIYARFREAVNPNGASQLLFTGEGTCTGAAGFAGAFRTSVTFAFTAGERRSTRVHEHESDARRLGAVPSPCSTVT